MKNAGLFFLILVSQFLNTTETFAWGPRGHQIICEVAVDLVKDETLSDFLKSRKLIMSYLCNIPDTAWRDLDYDLTSVGNPTHYLNPENLQSTLETLDSDFGSLAKRTGVSRNQLNLMMGSSWWRADQFTRLAIESGKRANESPKAKRSSYSKKSSNQSAFEGAIYRMMIHMGVLGHFVGDASMPYHNTKDHDGWEAGRGGIHSFYETDVVNELNYGFADEVFRDAQKIKLGEKSKKDSYVIARMRAMSAASRNELSQVEMADKIIEASSVAKSKRSEKKKKAVRPSAAQALKGFQPLIRGQMARSAATLADLWDHIYKEAGSPALQQYHSLKFPHEPEFIPPDYLRD